MTTVFGGDKGSLVRLLGGFCLAQIGHFDNLWQTFGTILVEGNGYERV